jgi:hypothetical protein
MVTHEQTYCLNKAIPDFFFMTLHYFFKEILCTIGSGFFSYHQMVKTCLEKKKKEKES